MRVNRIIILVAIALIMIAVYSSASAKEIIAGNDPETNFSTIQEAVNNSSPGDVIFVLPGTYNETVDVKVEGLSILSKSGNPEDTLVTGFFVYANNVTISRLSMQNTGIYGEDCFNCIFSDNVLFDSNIILRAGNDLTNVTIVNNTIQDGYIGLGGSSENTITNNTISNSISDTEDSYGITFYEGHSNYIAENHISSGKYGILMGRLSGNNEIINNILTSNNIGISVTDVSLGNNIAGNTITNNSIGIWEEYSWGNLITDNNVSLNKEYGVYLNKVSYEVPYTETTRFYNNIFNNTVNVLNDTGNYYTAEAVNNGAGITPVIWNTTKTSGTSIAGGPYLGGNFWAKPDGTGFSQVCTDSDGDGICDLSYNITGNDSDYLPLTSPPQPVPLVANFSANVTSGNAPLKVLFTDNSTGSPTSWLWNFGDGIYSKHAMNATHTFTRSGVYDITLTVTNAAGSDTVKKSSYITATALKAPVSAFTANVTSGKVPLVVKFTDTGTGGTPASWLWDFGDGIYSKHAMNATHTYTRAGTYDVTLTVKNDAGSNTTKKTGYIKVQSM